MDTGHAINIAAGEQLILALTALGADYDPSNAALKLPAFTAKHASASVSVDAVATANAQQDAVETDRANRSKLLPPLVTQAIGYYKSTGTDANKLADAKEFKRKIEGKRAGKKNGGDAPAGGVPVPVPPVLDGGGGKISVAQTSFVQKAEHLDGLIEVFKTDPLYVPNEANIKVTGLTGFSVQLHADNTAVFDATTTTQNSKSTRNLELYHPTTGFVPLANLAKEYVKGRFGANSPQYKQVRGIKFTMRPL